MAGCMALGPMSGASTMGSDQVSTTPTPAEGSWMMLSRQANAPTLVSAARVVDSGGSVVVTPNLRNLSAIGYSLCDYQDDNGESEGLRAEYYAVTHVRSAVKSTSVGPKNRKGCDGGKSTTELYRDCQKQTERLAGIRLPSARCGSPRECVSTSGLVWRSLCNSRSLRSCRRVDLLLTAFAAVNNHGNNFACSSYSDLELWLCFVCLSFRPFGG